jgi:hypothetical protein
VTGLYKFGDPNIYVYKYLDTVLEHSCIAQLGASWQNIFIYMRAFQFGMPATIHRYTRSYPAVAVLPTRLDMWIGTPYPTTQEYHPLLNREYIAGAPTFPELGGQKYPR